MARAKDSHQLAEYERRYRELAAQVASIGLIHSGSVTRRHTRCGTPGCKCHADPPQLLSVTFFGDGGVGEVEYGG